MLEVFGKTSPALKGFTPGAEVAGLHHNAPSMGLESRIYPAQQGGESIAAHV